MTTIIIQQASPAVIIYVLRGYISLVKSRGGPVRIELIYNSFKVCWFLLGYWIWFGWAWWHINHCRLFNAKSSLYIYIEYIGFGWVLWHINHCRLFNAKSFLYIHIKYRWFGWVWFYGISTIVGYLMPNPLYTYIYNIYDLVGFYGISTIVGYLMPNPLYT